MPKLLKPTIQSNILTSGEDLMVDCGYYHTVLLNKKTGIAYTWGNNKYGQLGRNVANGSATFFNIGKVTTLPALKSISAGGFHTYADLSFSSSFLTLDGYIYNCGGNHYGKLGRVVNSGSPTATNLAIVPSMNNIIKITEKANFSCFLRSDNKLYNCGDNNSGQIGRIVASGSQTSNNIGLLASNIVDMYGSGQASVYKLTNGDIYCCGVNNGALGDSRSSGSDTSSNYGKMVGMPSIKVLSGNPEVTNNYFNFHFVSTSGLVYNCGSNFYNNNNLSSSVSANISTLPNLKIISGFTDVIDIACGSDKTYYLKANGDVYENGNPPTKVEGLSNIVKLAAGRNFSIFIDAKGRVYNQATDNNNGQLGRSGTTLDQLTYNFSS
jgi:alpha-tubulin suppressor-like RCC1 family protein